MFLLGGTPYDASKWHSQKPDHYSGRLETFSDFVEFARILEAAMKSS